MNGAKIFGILIATMMICSALSAAGFAAADILYLYSGTIPTASQKDVQAIAAKGYTYEFRDLSTANAAAINTDLLNGQYRMIFYANRAYPLSALSTIAPRSVQIPTFVIAGATSTGGRQTVGALKWTSDVTKLQSGTASAGLDIVALTHPIATGLPATFQQYTSSGTLSYFTAATEVKMTQVAERVSSSDRVVTYIKENDLLSDGTLNQAKGVFFGVYDFTRWTTNTENMFKNALEYTLTETTPPVITILLPTGTVPTNSITLNITANEAVKNCVYKLDANANVSFGSGTSTFQSGSFNANDGAHSINVTCFDTSNNMGSAVKAFTVDTSVPVIANSSVNIGITNSTVIFDTNVNANSTVSIGTVSGIYTRTLNATAYTKAHSVNINALTAATNYFYKIKVCGQNGLCTTSAEMSFTTYNADGTDSTAPVLSNILVPSILTNSAVISWTTDDDSTSVVRYGLTNITLTSSKADAVFKKSHSITLTGLTNDTTYYFTVESCNNGGLCTQSAIQSFITDAVPVPDTTAPIVSLVSPADGFASTSSKVSLNYTVDDLENQIAYCLLIVDGITVGYDSSVTEGVTSGFDIYLANGAHNWRVQCADTMNNVGMTSQRSINVNYVGGSQIVKTYNILEDAKIMTTSPTTNYGSTTDLRTSSINPTGEVMSFVKFDTTPIVADFGSGVFTSAKLTLHTDPTWAQAGNVEIRKVTGSWSESTITSNNRPAVDPTVLGLVYVNQTNTAYNFSVLSIIQDAISNSQSTASVYLRREDGNSTFNKVISYISSEGSPPSSRPVLTVSSQLYEPVITSVNVPSMINEGDLLDASFSASDADNNIDTAYVEINGIKTNGYQVSMQTDYQSSGFIIVKFYVNDTTGQQFISERIVTVNDVQNIVVNEFSADGSNSWIELYNPTPVVKDLSGFTIEDDSAVTTALIGNLVPNGYIVLEQASSNFDLDIDSGDGVIADIILLKDNGILVDKVAYGSYNDGNTADNSLAPAQDESAGRITDGIDTDVDAADFMIYSSSEITKGTYNSMDPNDFDNDGIINAADNCPNNANPLQENLDGDAFGNVCDSDADGDGSSIPADCNDLNNQISPLRIEIPGDGIDQNCLNDAPLISVGSRSVNEDSASTPVNLLTYSSDVDNSVLTYTVLSEDASSVECLIVNGTDMIITAKNNFIGIRYCNITASDSSLLTTEKINVTVVNVNDAPIIKTQIPTQQIDEKKAFTLSNLSQYFDDIDTPIAALTYSANSSAPANVACVVSGNNLIITPALGFSGSASCSVRANDGLATSTDNTFTVQVIQINDAPYLLQNSTSIVIDEDTQGSLNVASFFADEENNPMTYIVSGNGGSVLCGISGNTLTINPSVNYFGDTYCLLRALDNSALQSNDFRVNITVNPVNDPLTYNPASQYVISGPGGIMQLRIIKIISEDVTYTFPDLSNHFIDVDGDNITFSIDREIINVSGFGATVCSIVGDDLVVVPPANASGSNIIYCAINATDGKSTPLTANFFVASVVEIPDAPTRNIVQENLTLAEDTTAVLEMLSKFSDVDSTVLTLAVQSNNPSVDCVVQGNSIMVVPDADFFGIATCSVNVFDETGLPSEDITLNITVTPVNDIPQYLGVDMYNGMSLDVGNAIEDEVITISGFYTRFSDIDGDTITVVQDGISEILCNIVGNNLVITPNLDYSGNQTCVLNVSDAVDTYTFIVQAEYIAINDAPRVISPINVLMQEDIPESLDLAGYYSDPENDVVTIDLVQNDLNVICSLFGTTITMVPVQDYNGDATCLVRVTDSGSGEYSDIVLDISVVPVNDAPVLAWGMQPILDGTIANKTIMEDSDFNDPMNLNENVLNMFFDVDGDAIILTVIDEDLTQVDCRYDSVADSFSVRPAANFTGNSTCTVTISDGTVTYTWYVNTEVLNVNDAPYVLLTPISTVVFEDTPKSEDVSQYFNDIDGAADGIQTTYQIISENLSRVNCNILNNQIVYLPAANFTGNAQCTVISNDGEFNSTELVIDITVANSNDAPEYTGDNLTITVQEDGMTTYDMDTLYSDLDGDQLTYHVATQAQNVDVTFNGNIATFTPHLDFNGIDYVILEAEDPFGEYAYSELIQIIVTPRNDAPVVMPLNTVRIMEGVLFNIADYNMQVSDIDGDTFTLSYSAPLDQNGLWQTNYTSADPNQIRYYAVSVVATDSNNESSVPMSFIIEVEEAGNRGPVIEDMPDMVVTEGDLVQLSPNASDLDDSFLVFTYDGAPFNSNGAWQTNFSDAGTYYISVTVTDGDLSDETGFTLYVVEFGNHAPNFTQPADVIMNQGNTYAFNPALYISDIDGDILSYTYGGVLDASGSFTAPYTLADNSVLGASVTVSDGTEIVTRTFTITVNDVNAAPVLYNVTDVYFIEGELIQLGAYAQDPDGDNLIVSFSGAGLNASGQWQTTFTDAGTYTYRLTATDGVNTISASARLIVLDSENHAPVLSAPDTLTLNEGQILDIGATALDVDGNPLSFTYESTLPINRYGRYLTTYTDAGVYLVNVSVTDGQYTDSKIVQVTIIESGNQAPIIDFPSTLVIKEGELITINPVVTDPDGDNVTVTISEPVGDDGLLQTRSGDSKRLDGTVIIITATDSNGLSTSMSVTLQVREEDFQKFQLSRISLPNGEDVQPGDMLLVVVEASNYGNIDSKETKMIITVPELGIRSSSKNIVLEEGETDTLRVNLEIPDWAAPGWYDMRINVHGEYENRVKHREFQIV